MGRAPGPEDFVDQEPPTVTGGPAPDHEVLAAPGVLALDADARGSMSADRESSRRFLNARHGTGFGTTRIPETRAVSPSAVARRSNPPGWRPVSSPSALTVATVVLLDVHSASTSSRVDPSESSRLARSVATYIEEMQRGYRAPTIKQHLAAIRRLFDWLVRGPTHVVRTGKTPVLQPAEARQLLDSIDTSTLPACAIARCWP